MVSVLLSFSAAQGPGVPPPWRHTVLAGLRASRTLASPSLTPGPPPDRPLHPCEAGTQHPGASQTRGPTESCPCPSGPRAQGAPAPLAPLLAPRCDSPPPLRLRPPCNLSGRPSLAAPSKELGPTLPLTAPVVSSSNLGTFSLVVVYTSISASPSFSIRPAATSVLPTSPDSPRLGSPSGSCHTAHHVCRARTSSSQRLEGTASTRSWPFHSPGSWGNRNEGRALHEQELETPPGTELPPPLVTLLCRKFRTLEPERPCGRPSTTQRVNAGPGPKGQPPPRQPRPSVGVHKSCGNCGSFQKWAAPGSPPWAAGLPEAGLGSLREAPGGGAAPIRVCRASSVPVTAGGALRWTEGPQLVRHLCLPTLPSVTAPASGTAVSLSVF